MDNIMIEAKEHVSMKHFDFTRANIGEHKFVENTLTIQIQNFGVIEGYSTFNNFTFFDECTLTYKNVVRSVREIHEYATSDFREFKPMYKKVDVDSDKTEEQVFMFIIEGVSNELNAWIQWEIVAKSVDIE